jgi:hypothetical protein
VEAFVRLRLLLTVSALSCLSSLSSLSWAGTFDLPLAKKIVDLGRSESSPERRAKVTCYFFARFMVKEVDMGEKGSDRLAIVPIVEGKITRCTKSQDPAEKIVKPDDWAGYFKGVKGNFVFFDADDGMNGGIPFAVYDAESGKKLFEDNALGPLAFTTLPDKTVQVNYRRVVSTGCPLPKDKSCWESAKVKLGLENASAPDCTVGYEKNAMSLAKGYCQTHIKDHASCLATELKRRRDELKDDPSALSFPVKVILGTSPKIKPVAGELRCWPAD